MSLDFYSTVGGRKFIDHTIPTLIKTIDRLAISVENFNEREERKEQGKQTFEQDMYNRILRFADEEDFECALSENSITLRQLHSMWVAYCILNDCEVDTATYDSQIARLWNALSNNTTNPFINFTDFDNYMCEDLV